MACSSVLRFAALAAGLAAAADPPITPQSARAVEGDGTTRLHRAGRAGNRNEVAALLRAGADVNAKNRYGITPLSLACSNGDAFLAEALLKAGADPKVELGGGQTMLMTAARSGHPAIVKMLLDRGAVVDAVENTFGETALMWAAAQNHTEAVQLLIAAGASVNLRTKPIEHKQDRFGLEGVLTVLPHGRFTPLMYAAREGSLGSARALVEAGAEVNAVDPDGTTALVFAILNGHYDTAAVLLEKGADPNLADTAGMAALYAAAEMSTLGEIFGRPRRKSTDELAAAGLIPLLIRRGAHPNAVLKAPTLLRAHTPGERVLSEGATAMMRAARNGDAEAIRVLLAHGADPKLAQKSGNTALMLASGQGRNLNTFADEYATEAQMIEAVKLLLDQKVDVNAATDAGQTALHFAALSMEPVVKLLIEHGANVNAIDKQGRTPLDFATGKGGAGRAGGPPVFHDKAAATLRAHGGIPGPGRAEAGKQRP